VLETTVGVGLGLAIAVAGIGCLLRPSAIQAYVIRSQSNTWAWRINPFSGWMQRPSYRVYLRFMGLVMLLFGALIILGASGVLQRCC